MDADLIRRVEDLEETVQSLRDLPDRTLKLEVRMGAVETQIVQLRVEMHDGFSAIRREMVTKADLTAFAMKADETFATKVDLERFATKADLELFATKVELATGLSALRNEFREDIAGMGRDLAVLFLESERRTRVLIEDLVGRIAAGREGSPPAI